MLNRRLGTVPNAAKQVVLFRAARTVRFLQRWDTDVGRRTILQICNSASTECRASWRYCFPCVMGGKFTDLLDILASPHRSVNSKTTIRGHIVR